MADLRKKVRSIKDKSEPSRQQLIDRIVPLAKQDIDNAMSKFKQENSQDPKDRKTKTAALLKQIKEIARKEY